MKNCKKFISMLLSFIIVLGVCAVGINLTATATKLTEAVYPTANNEDINDAYHALGAMGYFINNDGHGAWNQSEWFGIDDEGKMSVEYKISSILADKTMSGKGSLGEMGVVICNVDKALQKAGLDETSYPVELNVTEAKFVANSGTETVFNDMLNITEMQRDREGGIWFRISPVNIVDEDTEEVLVSATPEVAGWGEEGAFDGGILYFTVDFGAPATDDPPSSGVTAIEISDYTDLRAFAERVNSGETGLNAKLMNDIVCKNSPDDMDYATDWTPIGNEYNNYTGTFDGNGRVITGLSNSGVTDTPNYAGLFGCVGTKTEGGVTTKGTVKNVGLEGGSITGKNHVGGVAGRNYGTVTGCYNTGAVSGNNFVGGVVGINYGTLTGCYNTGNVTATATADNAYAGGVVGIDHGTLMGCYNTGDVTATATVDNAGAYTNAYAGGVAGMNNGTLTGCYNTGNVTATATADNADAYAGGVVGKNNQSLTNSYNTGAVTATANADNDDAYTCAYAGGVVGYNNDTLTNCYYDSDICTGVNAIGYGSGTNVTGLTTDLMTGANALSNMVFEYRNGEVSPWQTRANTENIKFYPHLKGFAYDSEPTDANWPPKIEAPVTTYPLWVGGNQVTSGNMDSLDALDGIAVTDGGSVKFEPKADGKGGTLYLNNATITGTQSYKFGGTHDSNILVENKEFNITINLEGENTLGPAERGIWMANNSASSGLALTGDGKLSITAEKNGIIINCDLLIDGADINVTATGGDSGGTGIIADDIDIRNSSVYAEGTGDQYGIFCASALTISDSSVESGCTGSYGRGLYFSDEENFTVSGDSFVTLEGGTRYGALWIKGSLITENGNEIVEPANYIIDPLETGSDVYLVYDVTADEKIPAVNVIITNPLTITATSNPTGGGTIKGGGKTYKGADVTLTAAPETGYDFVSWTEGNSVVSTNAKYSFTVEQSRNLVANFKLQVKSVSAEACRDWQT